MHRDGQNETAQAELAAVMGRRRLEPDAGGELTRSAKFWHAHVLYALGRFDDAEHERRELAAACDRLLGADHRDAVEAHEHHAVTLARLDRVTEAEAEMAGVAVSLQTQVITGDPGKRSRRRNRKQPRGRAEDAARSSSGGCVPGRTPRSSRENSRTVTSPHPGSAPKAA